MTGLGTLLAAGLMVIGVPATTPDAPVDGGARAATTGISLSGVSVSVSSATQQVVTVNHTRGSRARVALWQHDAAGWHRLARTRAGHTGYGGLVRASHRKQNTGTTPLGTFRLLASFGTHPRASTWKLDHRQIRSGDYWVQDNGSTYYNRYRNKSEGGFRWWLPQSDLNSSERLSDFTRQYEYSVVTSFNYAKQVRYRGSGIFLHVNGDGPTTGCVSAPRWFLKRVMATLDPAQRPVIAIGR